MIQKLLVLAGLVFSIWLKPIYALTLEEAQSLRKDFQSYQAWSLSRDYYFGTRFPKDRVKSLAWHMIYVSNLPDKYPSKNSLLNFYQMGLTQIQIAQAQQLAENLRIKYAISNPLTDEELNIAYQLRDETQAWNNFNALLPPTSAWNSFKTLMSWLDQHEQSETAYRMDKKAFKLYQTRQFPIVFGQVLIQGPEPANLVQTQVKLNEDGFFVSTIQGNWLEFFLPGYKPVVIPIASNQQIQGVGTIVLIKRSHLSKTGVVGRVLPWKGSETGNIVLTLDETDRVSNPEPWYHPAVPLTVTNNGEFYATGLVAGSYHVAINTSGINTTVKFAVKDG